MHLSEDETRKRDRFEVKLDLDIFVLKSTELLVLPDNPHIYLTKAKAEKFLYDLSEAVANSRDGIIIKLNGKINPRIKDPNEDESMFLSGELKADRVREKNP